MMVGSASCVLTTALTGYCAPNLAISFVNRSLTHHTPRENFERSGRCPNPLSCSSSRIFTWDLVSETGKIINGLPSDCKIVSTIPLPCKFDYPSSINYWVYFKHLLERKIVITINPSCYNTHLHPGLISQLELSTIEINSNRWLLLSLRRSFC